jgi:hypothetical protein
MALQDGMVLALQADATYNSLVNMTSTVPVGAVNKQVYPLVVYHQGTVLDLMDVNGSTGSGSGGSPTITNLKNAYDNNTASYATIALASRQFLF